MVTSASLMQYNGVSTMVGNNRTERAASGADAVTGICLFEDFLFYGFPPVRHALPLLARVTSYNFPLDRVLEFFKLMGLFQALICFQVSEPSHYQNSLCHSIITL